MARKQTTRPYQVFISHSGRDRWICERMRERIEGSGATVWLDTLELVAGVPVPETVVEALRSSDECLALISPSSKMSEWVLAEIGMAMMGRLFIVPVLLHVDRSELPSMIRNLSPIELNEFDVYVSQLTKRAQAQRKQTSRR